MDRSRSWSRHRPVAVDQPRSPSPAALRDSTSSTTSTSSRGRAPTRPPPSHRRSSRSRSSSASSIRSQTQSPSRRQHHSGHHQHERQQQHQRHSHNHEHHHGGLLKTSAGLIAGIGLATVLAHKVWPKDDEESESYSTFASRSKHHQHHHHSYHHHGSSPSSSSARHHEHHNRRPSDASSISERIVKHMVGALSTDTHVVKRIVDPARSTHGHDVVYVEESGPFRRGDVRRKSLDPRAIERMERQVGGRTVRPLPYPETPYPNEKFYEPRTMRASFSEAVPVSR